MRQEDNNMTVNDIRHILEGELHGIRLLIEHGVHTGRENTLWFTQLRDDEKELIKRLA